MALTALNDPANGPPKIVDSKCGFMEALTLAEADYSVRSWICTRGIGANSRNLCMISGSSRETI